MRNVPPDMDESVSEHIEHFFCVNHPEHYLMHQVCCLVTIQILSQMKPVFSCFFAGNYTSLLCTNIKQIHQQPKTFSIRWVLTHKVNLICFGSMSLHPGKRKD